MACTTPCTINLDVVCSAPVARGVDVPELLRNMVTVASLCVYRLPNVLCI